MPDAPVLQTNLNFVCTCGNVIFNMKGDTRTHVIAIAGQIKVVCAKCGAERVVMQGHGKITIEKSGDVQVTL